MSRKKYIVFESEGTQDIFTFPTDVDHDRMAEAIMGIRKDVGMNSWERPYRHAGLVSAGFVINGQCQGRSETLKLDSRGDQDTDLLR